MKDIFNFIEYSIESETNFVAKKILRFGMVELFTGKENPLVANDIEEMDKLNQ